MPSTRRGILALGVGLLSTGCIGNGPTSTGTSTTEKPSATSSPTDGQRTTHTKTGCQSGVNVWTTSFDPASDLPVRLDETERSIVTEAVTSGSSEFTTYRQPPLSSGVIVAHDGNFYQTDHTTVDSERVPAFTLNARWEQGQEAPPNAVVVAFDDLPAVDRNVLRSVLLGPEQKGLPEESIEVNDFPAPYSDGDESRLVGSVTWVRWRDRTFRVEVADASKASQERRTYRYTVETVATSDDEFRRVISNRCLVELDAVDGKQRSIVETALDDTYGACKPQSDALADLREWLAEKPNLPEPYERSWYVTFDDRRYRLQIVEWVR